MKITPQTKEWPLQRQGRIIMRLVAGAIVSTSISTLIAAVPGKLLDQNTSHLFFIVVVGMIGLLLGRTRFVLGRLDSAFVFVSSLSRTD